MSMIIARGVVSAIKDKRQSQDASLPFRDPLQKLSSGSRVAPGHGTGEDPAALKALSARLERLVHHAETRFDAKNVLAIAEGALSELNSLLKWMQALALPPGSDGYPPYQIALEAAAEDFFPAFALTPREEKIAPDILEESQALSMNLA